MSWISILSIGMAASAAVWAIQLPRRLRDWRFVGTAVALLLITTGQILAFAGNPILSVGGFTFPARQLTDLLLSAAALVGVPLALRRIVTRRRVIDSVEQSEARLRQIIDLVPHMLFAKDWESRILLANKALADAYGKTPEQLIGIRQEAFQLSAEELARFLADDRAVMSSGKRKFIPEEPFTDHDGEVRILETTKIPFTASGSDGPAILGVAVDITERKQATDALQRTLRELDHRVKNTLALVVSIASQSAVDAESIDGFVADFRGRIEALERVHDALRDKAWRGVALHRLIANIVAPYRRDEKSVEIEGPEVLVPAERVQILGMALHELVANAAKYGAGSDPGGRIRISWRVEPAAMGRILSIDWRESDGPAVRLSGRRGMGLRIIEEGLQYEADAQAKVYFEPTGVRAEIVLPLDDRAPDQSTAPA